jgi:flagellar biosynthesis anti-sigma factor FlgM
MRDEKRKGTTIMVVDDILQKAATLLRNDGGSRTTSSAEQTQRPGTPTTDKVDISGLIQRMTTTMTDYDMQRAQKVAALKDLVNSGSYRVSGHEVAEKMIASMRGKS